MIMPLTLAGATALTGGLSFLGDTLGNLFGKKNQDNANETNLKINQMNNEFNANEAEKAFQREMLYNDRIRQEDRVYNSAKSQVERYREAGLNPALMMQGQSAGMAQSNGVSSSPASAAPSAPQQGFTPNISRALSDMMVNIMRAKETDANVNFLDSQSDVLRAKAAKEIEGMSIDNKWKDRMYQKNYDHLNSQIGYNRAQESYMQAMEDYQIMVNSQVPEKLASEIALNKALKGQAGFNSTTDIGKLIDDYEKRFGKLPFEAKRVLFGLDSFSNLSGKVLNLQPKK